MKATTSATLANFSASESRISTSNSSSFDFEFVFEGHHEFHAVEGVGTEVVTEFGFRLHIFSLNAELVNDNSGDLLENFFVHCNLHLDLIV